MAEVTEASGSDFEMLRECGNRQGHIALALDMLVFAQPQDERDVLALQLVAPGQGVRRKFPSQRNRELFRRNRDF